MSNLNRHPVRRAAAGVLASTLALSGVAIGAGISPANAAPGFGFDRVAGNDRYETSAATSARFRLAATTGITNVILASGESGRTPDALAASFLAGVQSAPVVLTRRDNTPEVIVAELRALRTAGATTLTIVGGSAAISELQVTELRALGFTTINRLGGANRYDTARAIVAAGESAAASNVGLVASGVSTIDALAGGPLAYKGKHPLFLVTRDGIPAATLAALRESGVTSVYVLGGASVVGPAVVAQLATAGVTVTARLAGQDRSATSVAIADAIIANFGFDKTTFNLASGANEGIDALGGAALSGRQNRALLITNTATSAPPVVAFATRNAALLTARGLLFGGAAVVTPALEAQITAAGGGSGTVAPNEGQVTLVSNTVQQGGTLSGNVAGVNNRSVTVSGCGFTNSVVPIGAFSLVIPASQPVGACTLTFTVTNNQGVVTKVTQAVTVTAATVVQGTGTSLPELASATIVQTLAANGTTVRYTFDEALTTTIALVPANFVVYTFASDGVAGRTVSTPAGAATIEAADNRSVLVNFPTITTSAGAAALSVATVEVNAVRDLQNEANPIGDAALNPSGTTSTPLTGGVTAAPDLVTVGNFRVNPANANRTLVDFTFDEAADAPAPGSRSGYRLINTDGVTVRTGTVVSGAGFTGVGATVENSGTTVHTVEFENRADAAALESTLALSAAGQSRGVVLAGTVNEGTGTGNLPNVLQAADVTGGISETPDLVSVSIIRDATVAGVTGTRDQLLYTFDEPVNLGENLGNFLAYTNGATLVSQTAGTSPLRSTANANQVLVTFGAAANALGLAVGGSVDLGAVVEAAGSNRPNEADEEGISNVGVGTTTNNVSGRTVGPDLIAVAVERTTDAFGVTNGARVRYTFDEDVATAAVVDVTKFFLYEANGALVTGATGAAIGTTEDTDNQVVVSYTSGSTVTEPVLRAILGTVNDGAVFNQVAPTGTPAGTGTPGSATNPEGAQLATGTTGTPRV